MVFVGRGSSIDMIDAFLIAFGYLPMQNQIVAFFNCIYLEVRRQHIVIHLRTNRFPFFVVMCSL